jgi:hypothetical protein
VNIPALVRLYKAQYSGPIPPGAEDRGDYVLVDSDIATRLLEREMRHRRSGGIEAIMDFSCCQCSPPPGEPGPGPPRLIP